MAVAERPRAPSAQPLHWDGRRLRALDQTLLPAQERVLELRGADDVAAAIGRLAIRGAPVIGVAAAYGLAMAAARDPRPDALAQAARTLETARPTAANLAWAVRRVLAAAEDAIARGEDVFAAASGEAAALDAENAAATDEIARRGADLLAGARRVLTHCNTGPLAAGGRGTALGVIAELAARDAQVGALVCETRPLLQGARLTVWELRRLGIAHELIVDAAAPGLIAGREVDAVVVGLDRAAANGDVANKVGTYGLALAAREARIPFVVAGPVSSIDARAADGSEIAIEQREADEVRRPAGALATLADAACRNPAFDVTPAELITALVTERGVARPVNRSAVAALLR